MQDAREGVGASELDWPSSLPVVHRLVKSVTALGVVGLVLEIMPSLVYDVDANYFTASEALTKYPSKFEGGDDERLMYFRGLVELLAEARKADKDDGSAHDLLVQLFDCDAASTTYAIKVITMACAEEINDYEALYEAAKRKGRYDCISCFKRLMPGGPHPSGGE